MVTTLELNKLRRMTGSEAFHLVVAEMGKTGGLVDFTTALDLIHADWQTRFNLADQKIQSILPNATPTDYSKYLKEWTSVTLFGAKGDGSDDSTAIQNALNSGAKRIWFPPAPVYYKVKNLVVPAGVELYGSGRKRVYNPYEAALVRDSGPTLFYDTTGTWFIKYGGLNSVVGLNFFGANRTVDGLGVDHVNTVFFRDCTMALFRAGFGSDGGYIRNSRFWNCHASQNTTGFSNLVDSHVYGAEINANKAAGVSMMSGANDTVFVGVKNEWNDGNNWTFYQNSSNSVIGGITDRAGQHGFSIKQALLAIAGLTVRRSGRLNGSAGHFELGSNTGVVIQGVITRAGSDDGGEGAPSPSYTIVPADSTTGPVIFTGCDMRGFVTSMRSTGIGVEQLRIKGCLGAADTRDGITVTSTQTINTATPGKLTVAGEAMRSLPINTPIVSIYWVEISGRNPSVGATFYNRFQIRVSRGGGGAAQVTMGMVENPSDTVINTTGSAMTVSVGNVNEDGTSFDVNVAVTNANTYQVRMNAYSQ